MSDWTNVYVQPEIGGDYLLDGGTGSGGLGEFACSVFSPNALPTKGAKYRISAVPDGGMDPMDWVAVCKFAGTVSRFDEN